MTSSVWETRFKRLGRHRFTVSLRGPIDAPGTTLTTTPPNFRDLWETNFYRPWRCIQQFAEPLTANRGHIVLVGSLASKVAAGYLGALSCEQISASGACQQLRLETSRAVLHTPIGCPGPISRDDQQWFRCAYAAQAPEVPAAAHQPGGGARWNDQSALAGREDSPRMRRATSRVGSAKRARLLFAAVGSCRRVLRMAC